MLLPGLQLLFVLQEIKILTDSLPCCAWLNHILNVATLSSDHRIGETINIVSLQLI